MAIYAECITFAEKFGETENNTERIYKKGYEDFEGKKTLDNPDDGNDTDSRLRFGGRRAYL